MKNVFYSQAIIAFFLTSFFLYSPQANAQSPFPSFPEVMKVCGLGPGTGAPETGPCSLSDFSVELDENCQGTIDLFIYMVGLEEHHITRNLYGLPSALPEIWVRHESSPGNEILSGPYDVAHFLGTRPLADDNPRNVFGIPLQLEMEAVENRCQGELGEDRYTTYRKVEMVTPDAEHPSGYAPYPIHDFANNETSGLNVWSCNAFYDTWCNCHVGVNPGPNGGDCPDYKPDPTYNFNICFVCGTSCIDFQGEFRKRETLTQENEIQVEINPNPFDQEMKLSAWIPQDGDVTYTLYDARGTVVLQQTEFQKKGMQSHLFVTSNLSSGVYYIHYRQGTQQGVQKVLKY